jgi:hypothetical protein
MTSGPVAATADDGGGGDAGTIQAAAAAAAEEEEVEESEEESCCSDLSPNTRRVGDGEEPDSSERMPDMPESKLRLGRLRRTESEMAGRRRRCWLCCLSGG